MFSLSKNKINLKHKSNKLKNPSKIALIIIDVQEKLLNAIPDNLSMLSNIQKVVDASNIFNIKVFATEQNPEKLGSSEGLIAINTLENKYSKMDFSCIGCDKLMKELKSKKITNILICGVETHICVLQSAIDLWENHFNVHVIADATKSRKEYDHKLALQRMKEIGIAITTTETAIFEICSTAKRQEFRNISEIIKRKS